MFCAPQTLQAAGSEQDAVVYQLSNQVRHLRHLLTLCVCWECKPDARQTTAKVIVLRDPGIEPGSVPWQGTILPLNQPR